MAVSQATPGVACSVHHLLIPSSAALLGTDALCSWLSSSSLTLTYPPSSALAGGETLGFADEVISAASNPSAFMYAGAAAVLARRPAPSVVSAQLSSTGSSILVAFDGESSQTFVNGSRSAPCDLVFEGSVLGLDSLCRWTSGTTLLATLGASANASSLVQPTVRMSGASGTLTSTATDCSGVIGTTVLALRAGVIRAVSGSVVTTGRQCVRVAFPTTPTPPVVSISAPRHIGRCDDLYLDGSGSMDPSGRTPTFRWSILALNDAASNTSAVALLQDGTPNSASAVVVLAAGVMAPLAQYRFTLTVSSYLGGVATASVVVSVADLALPEVVIDGSENRVVPANVSPTLVVSARVNDCNGTVPSTPLVYSWSMLSVVRNPVTAAENYSVSPISASALASYSKDNPTRLKLPKLQVGCVYVFQATVVTVSSTPVSNSATAVVTVASAGVAATIQGGDRQVGFDAFWQLDASKSVDLDGLSTPFSFQWSCTANGEACFTDAGGAFSVADAVALSGSPAVLAVSNGTLSMGMYVFTVTVSKGAVGELIPNHYRSSSSSVTVTIVAGQPPEVQMLTSSVRVTPSQPRVTLSADVIANGRIGLSYKWSCADMTASELQVALLSPTLTTTSLVIRPVLSPGTYTFTFTVSDASSAVSGFARVIVASPPRNGFVTISPPTGYAIQTTFTMSALEWVGDVENLPLLYRFAYIIGGSESQLSGAFQSANTLRNFVLPSGTIQAVVYVRDAVGGLARTSVEADRVTLATAVCTAIPAADVASVLANSAQSLITDALAQGRVSDVLTNIGSMAQVLSSASDPCASVSCGSSGTCFKGNCTCSNGYTGARCELAPAPVDGVWSDWSAFSSCSRSCGGGIQTATRVCTAPRYGGAPCVGSPTLHRDCNTNACLVIVNGGYSAWSEWGECSASCPGTKSGYFLGTRTRTRVCDSPAPSVGGASCEALGDAVSTQPCNTELCYARAKLCPGSSATLRAEPNPLYLPDVECNGNGQCSRDVVDGVVCREGDNCNAVCLCSEGFSGSDCGMTAAEMAAAQAMRSMYLSSLVRVCTYIACIAPALVH
jgi:hypothetical protein